MMDRYLLIRELEIGNVKIPVTVRQEIYWEHMKYLKEEPVIAVGKEQQHLEFCSWLSCTRLCCRQTGRSYLEALYYIDKALKNPGVSIDVLDDHHFGVNSCARNIYDLFCCIHLVWNRHFAAHYPQYQLTQFWISNQIRIQEKPRDYSKYKAVFDVLERASTGYNVTLEIALCEDQPIVTFYQFTREGRS
jgi:hypothetical protein